MAAARLHENLERLLAELQTSASGDARCQERLARPHADAARLAAHLPLSHCLSEAAFLGAVRDGRLRSQQQLGRLGRTEQDLGTGNYVFTYVAPFRYPGTLAGFLFAPQLEANLHARGVATPFDSGGLLGHFARPDPTEPARDFLVRHELPLRQHRDLLERVLACSFAEPSHYVQGRALDGPHPAGLEQRQADADARLYTFEVRFEATLPLDQPLLAVFLPVALAALGDVLRATRRWREHGVTVKRYLSPWARGTAATVAWPYLLSEGLAFVKDHLGLHDE